MERALFFNDPFFSPFIQAYLFVLGTVIGSFLNVCIYRLPLRKSVVTPRSSCPHCEKVIPWYYNIPLLSYLLLLGRCAYCREPISAVYPLVELATGVLFLALYRSFGISGPFLIYAVFGCSMIALIFIDYYHRLLPWRITFPGIALGLLSSFVNPFITPLESVLGMLLGGGVLGFVFVVFKWIRKKEGMGDGDIVMLAMVGAFLGWQQVLLILFFSSFLGSVIGLFAMLILRKGSDFPYPYGTFIGVAAIPAIFWGERIWHFYIR